MGRGCCRRGVSSGRGQAGKGVRGGRRLLLGGSEVQAACVHMRVRVLACACVCHVRVSGRGGRKLGQAL